MVDSLSVEKTERTEPGPLGAGSRCCSDLKLDSFLDGELSPAAAKAVEEHLAVAQTCRARVDELRVSRQEFARAMPPRRVVKPQPRNNVIRVAFGSAGAVFALAAGVLLFVNRPDETAIKGNGVSATIYAHDGIGARVVDDDGIVRPGDDLRFSVRSSQAAFVAVVAKDGRGDVMAYAPVEGDAVAVAAGIDTPLPGAVKLDAVLGREELTVWSCDKAVAVGTLVGAVNAGVDIDGCRRALLVVNKVAP